MKFVTITLKKEEQKYLSLQLESMIETYNNSILRITSEIEDLKESAEESFCSDPAMILDEEELLKSLKKGLKKLKTIKEKVDSVKNKE